MLQLYSRKYTIVLALMADNRLCFNAHFAEVERKRLSDGLFVIGSDVCIDDSRKIVYAVISSIRGLLIYSISVRIMVPESMGHYSQGVTITRDGFNGTMFEELVQGLVAVASAPPESQRVVCVYISLDLQLTAGSLMKISARENLYVFRLGLRSNVWGRGVII